MSINMLIYLRLSQLIGSTLALEYLRAEYVAPLGSCSLIFNFLFARYVNDFIHGLIMTSR